MSGGAQDEVTPIRPSGSAAWEFLGDKDYWKRVIKLVFDRPVTREAPPDVPNPMWWRILRVMKPPICGISRAHFPSPNPCHSARLIYISLLLRHQPEASPAYSDMRTPLGTIRLHGAACSDRFEVDSANAVRQFLEHHHVPNARIQTAWDSIALHTTPGIAAYKPLEVELLYNGVALDVLGIGYATFPEQVRTKVVAAYPRVNFKQDIANAFLGGFDHKTETTVFTCNEDICTHLIQGYKRAGFYETIQNSSFQNS